MDFLEAAKSEISKSIPKDRSEYWDGYRKALDTFEKAIRRNMTSERKNITQPADWWAAFETAANKTHNGNLSAWLGDCGRAALPAKIAAKLSDRPAANRPKKTD